MLRGGLWTFIVTSLLIGLSPNLLLLNLLRAVEGLGGALVLTSATSLLAQEFEGAQRTRAFSFLGTAFGVGLAFGPMASGFLIERLAGARALYFAIALIAVLILLLGTRRIRESRDPAAQGIDWPGTLLFTAALVALTFGIVRGPQDGWTSPRVLSLLVGTAVLLAAFVAVESRRPRPMLELSLFRYPRFIGVQLLPVATGFSFIALIVYLPIWFIVIQGRDAFTAGLAILPLTAPMRCWPDAWRNTSRPACCRASAFCFGARLLGLDAPVAGWRPVVDGDPDVVDRHRQWPALGLDGCPVGQRGAQGARGHGGRHLHHHARGGEAIAIAAIGAVLIGLTALKLEAAAWPTRLLPQATVVASQIGAGAGHGLPAAGGTMQATVVEYAHRAYTAAFQDIFGVLAVLSILTAVVCIVTLRQPMLDPAPEAGVR